LGIQVTNKVGEFMRIYHDQQKFGDHWGSRGQLSADFI
jgi:hypothetical protein